MPTTALKEHTMSRERKADKTLGKLRVLVTQRVSYLLAIICATCFELLFAFIYLFFVSV